MTAENSVRISDLIAPVFMPVHREIKRGEYSEYWLKGGRGSCKSSFASLEIILGMMRNPEANAIVYRKVGATLRESVYEQLVWAIDMLGVREYWRLKLTPLALEYRPTGQKIMFRGADDPGKSKSIKLSRGYFGYLWFEELAEFPGMEGIRTIKASIFRGTKSERTITLCSYNPPVSAGNWVNAESLKPVEGRRVHESSYLDVPPEWLGDEFIAEAERLKSGNERAYRHMYLGEVTGTGGNVFDNLEIRRIPPEELDKLSVFYNGLDFGFAVDPDAFTRWAWESRTRTLYAVGEYIGLRTPVEKLVEKIKAASTGPVRCDSADPRMIDSLRRHGITAQGVKKGPGSVEHGVRWLQDLSRIVIDPARTPGIAKEFSAYEYAQNKDGEFISEYPDKNNHTIDAARYALEPVIGQRTMKTLNKSALGL